MASRRKYKQYAARVSIERALDQLAGEPAPPVQAPPVAPTPPPGGDGASPMQRALQAQQHAESLQQQHQHRQAVGLPEPPRSPAEQQAIDAHVDSAPGLTDHQRRFLKSHPSLLLEPYTELLRHAVVVARHAGLKEDTPEFDSAILLGVQRSIEHHHHLKQLTSPASGGLAAEPPGTQMHQDVDEHAAELSREAAAHLAEHQPPAPPPS